MKPLPIIVLVLLPMLALFGTISVCSAKPPATTQPRTIGQLVATRPAPNLTGLAQRSAPDMKNPDSTEAFWDILKLRSTGDEKAVPILAEILSRNAGTGRIHGYAAAQALFCIGGKDARAALDKHLSQLQEYNERLACLYIYHWDMPEPKRSEFIDAYLLKASGQGVELVAEAKAGEDGTIQFQLTVKNTSTIPLDILTPPLYRLYLRSKDGRFLARYDTGIKEDYLGAKWVVLKPGETQTVTENAVIKFADALRKDDPQIPNDIPAVLQVEGTLYHIDKLDQYEAIFVLEYPPVTPGSKEQAQLASPWSGRAIAKPILIQLAPVVPQNGKDPRDR